MRTMLAIGAMQSRLEDKESPLGYCKARGLQQWMRVDHTRALLTTEYGAPIWKHAVYRTVIEIDTQEVLEDMRP
eukprot:1455735-Lingulodinium_polyedra.AAC.1